MELRHDEPLHLGQDPHRLIASLSFGSQPVTQLTFLNDGTAGHYWLVDNINYSTVPEPAGLALFGGGLLVLGAGFAMRRRRAV